MMESTWHLCWAKGLGVYSFTFGQSGLGLGRNTPLQASFPFLSGLLYFHVDGTHKAKCFVLSCGRSSV